MAVELGAIGFVWTVELQSGKLVLGPEVAEGLADDGLVDMVTDFSR